MKLYHIITTITAHPFENRHVKKIINKWIGLLRNNDLDKLISICDPFSNNKTTRRQGTTLISNDLNPKFNSTYNLEFNDFGKLMKSNNERFDLILFDPPYSLTQLKKQYEGIGKKLEQWQSQRMWTAGKDALATTVKPGGIVISFGWTSQGFGKHRGFEKVELYNIEQSGRDGQYNLQITVEQKVDHNLFENYINDGS